MNLWVLAFSCMKSIFTAWRFRNLTEHHFTGRARLWNVPVSWMKMWNWMLRHHNHFLIVGSLTDAMLEVIAFLLKPLSANTSGILKGVCSGSSDFILETNGLKKGLCQTLGCFWNRNDMEWPNSSICGHHHVDETARLVSRHWEIIEEGSAPERVDGDGVRPGWLFAPKSWQWTSNLKWGQVRIVFLGLVRVECEIVRVISIYFENFHDCTCLSVLMVFEGSYFLSLSHSHLAQDSGPVVLHLYHQQFAHHLFSVMTGSSSILLPSLDYIRTYLFKRQNPNSACFILGWSARHPICKDRTLPHLGGRRVAPKPRERSAWSVCRSWQGRWCPGDKFSPWPETNRWVLEHMVYGYRQCF